MAACASTLSCESDERCMESLREETGDDRAVELPSVNQQVTLAVTTVNSVDQGGPGTRVRLVREREAGGRHPRTPSGGRKTRWRATGTTVSKGFQYYMWRYNRTRRDVPN
ncbi:hypothetical protein Bbelb_109320 [Branchiostoma belcheri]|nr:hypothetical protein Bbelb_109320 [Branchiostoma belcheri]